MLRKHSISNAFTLMEILLVFFVIGIIFAIAIPNTTSNVNNIANADLSYATFNAIKGAITESRISDGTTTFDSATKVCNAMSKHINTTKYDCSNNTMTFLNGSTVKSINYSATTGSTVTVDIDGSRRNGTEASGDIIQILVTKNGTVLPTGTNAIRREYLQGKYGIDNNGKYTWKEQNISYKTAVCKSGNMVGIDNCSTYCGANFCTINGSSIAEDCKTGLCEIFLQKPLNLK